MKKSIHAVLAMLMLSSCTNEPKSVNVNTDKTENNSFYLNHSKMICIEDHFNATHPELERGERFFENIGYIFPYDIDSNGNIEFKGHLNHKYYTEKEFDEINFKTKRLGMRAYDRNGKFIEDMRPVFIQTSELKNYRKKNTSGHFFIQKGQNRIGSSFDTLYFDNKENYKFNENHLRILKKIKNKIVSCKKIKFIYKTSMPQEYLNDQFKFICKKNKISPTYEAIRKFNKHIALEPENIQYIYDSSAKNDLIINLHY